ncbi:MAG: addiction module protein [Proteobacteria bacterium]|nr:addiction module protein [Pseudomonadota bacterium]
MSRLPVEALEAEAMKLSPLERAELADRLWLSVHTREEVDAAWEAEVERRIRQIDAGEVECVPWEAVMTELHDRLR